MREIPMLFSTEMVQALIDGRKTVTRRTKGLENVPNWIDNFGYSTFTPEGHISGRGLWNGNPAENFYKNRYGQKGDLIWVRETFYQPIHEALNGEYFYKAQLDRHGWDFKWKPSIHMPKEAARIWLLNEGVTVERLQDITRQDCINEGIGYVQTNHEKWGNIPGSYFDYERETYAPLPSGKISPSMSFMSLWRSINGAESWEANPWVWVVRLKVVSTTGREAVQL
jgi:hypothetical protein